MTIGDPDWIIKLGPITLTNHAGTKKQAEEGYFCPSPRKVQ